MDAFKKSLGFASNDSSERAPPNLICNSRQNYEISGGGFDSISTSMVVVEGPPSLDQRGVGGCIEANSLNGYDSTGSPGANSVSSNEGSSSAPPMKDKLVSMWNNMKFSKTIWALDSKKVMAFASGSGSGFSNTSPVWLMGKCYQTNNNSSNLSNCDPNNDTYSTIYSRDENVMECSAAGMSALTADFHSKIWMTYRKDFEVFKGTHIDSDCGWGCMIRAGQMIVANTLISLHLGRHWRWKCDEKRPVYTADDIQNEGTHRAIVRLFADDTSAPFSIHKIVEIGQETIRCKPGDWFGPGSTAHLFKQAIHSAQSNLHKSKIPATLIPDWCHVNLISSFKIYVATDGTIYKQDVRDMCDTNCKESKRQIPEEQSFSLEKEGGFSFLDRLDIEEHAKSVKEHAIHRRSSRERGISEGFTQIDDLESSSVDKPLNHNESFDSVTEAVLLDDGIIRQCSLSQQVSVDGETWLTEEFSENVETHISNDEKQNKRSKGIPIKKSEDWTPVLLLVPVRLGGGEKLNPIYEECVKAILASDNCVGIIGGRPRHALYFVGFQDDNLIHLDPHLVQDNVAMIDKNRVEETLLPIDFDLTTYHCKSVRKMQLSKMDPSCCFGFLCRTSSDFENWCEIINDLATPSGATDYPIFSIMEGRVSVHLGDSDKLFSQCMDGDATDGTIDIDKPAGKVTSNTSAANSDSDADDFVFL